MRSESGVLLWCFYHSILGVLRHPVAKRVHYIRLYDRRSGYRYKWDCFILNLIVFVTLILIFFLHFFILSDSYSKIYKNNLVEMKVH